jgi:hypothetical protein
MRKLMRSTAMACCAVVMLLASAAAAQDLGNDEVTLKNGGSVRGTVVAVEPGTKVVILEFGQKDPRTIPWAEVADVEKGKYAPSAGAGEVPPGDASPGYDKPAPEEPASPSEEAKGPAIMVHIDANRPVVLVEHVGSTFVQAGGYGFAIEHTRVVCQSPCDRKVNASKGQEFAIAGDGVVVSEPFKLKEQSGPTTLVVDAGSRRVRVGGVWLTTFGGIFTGLGAVSLGVGFGLDNNELTRPMKIAGGVSLGVGLTMLSAGITMIVTQSTSVDVRGNVNASALDWDSERASGSYRPRSVEPRIWAGEF